MSTRHWWSEPPSSLLSPLLSWFPNKENWRQARPVLCGAACNLATCSTHSTQGNYQYFLCWGTQLQSNVSLLFINVYITKLKNCFLVLCLLSQCDFVWCSRPLTVNSAKTGKFLLDPFPACLQPTCNWLLDRHQQITIQNKNEKIIIWQKCHKSLFLIYNNNYTHVYGYFKISPRSLRFERTAWCMAGRAGVISNWS